MKKTFIFFISMALAFFIILPGCSREPERSAAGNTGRQDNSAPEEISDPGLDGESSGNEEVRDEESEEDSSSETALEKLAGMERSFQAANAFPGLSFQRPLGFYVPDDGSKRIFIVEQAGKILTIYPDGGSGLFLDIQDRVDDSGNEMGLLGLAFHPDFSGNGLFYLNYTSPEGTAISEYKISSEDPEKADPESEKIILAFSQPYSNHNGGQLAFGPDGYLYIGTGDGGSAGDPGDNGQNRETLLGNILRIDVDGSQDGLAYSIPGDNPFFNNDPGFRQEIFAYGLRNPWRFSFDPASGRLWAADVGQDQIEEIDIIEKGKNYGWNIMEGSRCFEPPSDCDARGLVLPVYEYDHSQGSSITGGYVYHGESLPVLKGIYVYADFVSGNIWGLSYAPEETVRNFILAETDLNISSFGLDENNELYFTAFDGNIYKLAVNQAAKENEGDNSPPLEYVLYEFQKRLIQEIGQDYQVLDFDTKPELIDYLSEVSDSSIAEKYVNQFYEMKDGELYIIPRDGPMLIDTGKDYTVNKISQSKYQIVQTGENELWGHYTIETTLEKTGDDWLITGIDASSE